MSDYAEMADGPIEPTQPSEPAAPEPPYIRYRPWTPTPGDPISELQAAMQKMQEAICHLELQVHRLLNQEGEL